MMGLTGTKERLKQEIVEHFGVEDTLQSVQPFVASGVLVQRCHPFSMHGDRFWNNA